MHAKHTIRIVSVVSLLAGLLFLGCWILGCFPGSAARKAELRLFQGRPRTIAEITPPAVPEADNGAILYSEAVARLKRAPDESGSLWEGTADSMDIRDLCEAGSLPPEKLQALHAQFSKAPLKDIMDLIRQATAKPGCQYVIRLCTVNTSTIGCLHCYGLSGGMPMFELRRLSDLLIAASLLEAMVGKPAMAWDTAIAFTRKADALRSQPLPLPQGLRCYDTRRAAITVRRLAAVASPSAAQTETLMASLKPLEDREPMARGVDGTRLMLMDAVFDDPGILHGYPGPGEQDSWEGKLRRLSANLTVPLFYASDHRACTAFFLERARHMELPYWQVDNADFVKRTREVPQQLAVTRSLVDRLRDLKQAQTTAVAAAAVTRAGLALLQYHQQQGVFPDALTTVAGGPYTDPFTGEPLRYRKAGAGFVVYSVDEDLHDNDGAPPPMDLRHDGTSGGEHDEVWHYVPPAPTAR